jgi:hypothetical protein
MFCPRSARVSAAETAKPAAFGDNSPDVRGPFAGHDHMMAPYRGTIARPTGVFTAPHDGHPMARSLISGRAGSMGRVYGGRGRHSTARLASLDVGPPRGPIRIVAALACRTGCSHRSRCSRGHGGSCSISLTPLRPTSGSVPGSSHRLGSGSSGLLGQQHRWPQWAGADSLPGGTVSGARILISEIWARAMILSYENSPCIGR